MARAWVAVGEYDKAQSLVEGEQLEDYQVGVVGSEINAAQDATEAELKQQLAEHRATLQLQLMDRSQTAIRSLLKLYGRFYQEVAQRDQIESTIKSGWRGVPLEIQIRTLIALGQHAVDNQDLETASRLAGEANAMVRDANFSPQWFVRLMSPVAALTHASGQEGAARQMLDECRGLFDASFQEINPVYRNRTMVALAEGYFAIGDPWKPVLRTWLALNTRLQTPMVAPKCKPLFKLLAPMRFMPNPKTKRCPRGFGRLGKRSRPPGKPCFIPPTS